MNGQYHIGIVAAVVVVVVAVALAIVVAVAIVVVAVVVVVRRKVNHCGAVAGDNNIALLSDLTSRAAFATAYTPFQKWKERENKI
jgi:hypothetical protein